MIVVSGRVHLNGAEGIVFPLLLLLTSFIILLDTSGHGPWLGWHHHHPPLG